MKSQLILVTSKRMDSNKKDGRYEDRLIRLSEKARSNLGLSDDKTVELWPDNNTPKDRINRSKILKIFQAYSTDLAELRESKMSGEEYNRVGFVTTKTFNYICGQKTKKVNSIWIADTIEDTVIGADPEFALIDNGTFTYASHIDGFCFEGELGSDGPLAEIRPAPAVDIEDFVDNITTILRTHKNADLIQSYDWVSGCFFSYDTDNKTYSYCVGGHAHIGTPAQVGDKIKESQKIHMSLFACLQKALDEYIVIPMIKIEGKDNTTNRRCSYGRFGDHRTEHGRLECRTLSGYWLAHPELAKAVMGSVKAVSHAFFKIAEENGYKDSLFLTEEMERARDTQSPAFHFWSDNFDKWSELEITKALKATKSSAEMRAILDRGDITFNRQFCDGLKKKFRSLPTYREYSKYIDMFMEIVSLPTAELKEIDCNLKHTWVDNKKFII